VIYAKLYQYHKAIIKRYIFDGSKNYVYYFLSFLVIYFQKWNLLKVIFFFLKDTLVMAQKYQNNTVLALLKAY